MNCLTLLSLLLLVLVLGPWPSTVVATVLFPMEGSTLLPLDYMNTTGVIDLDNPVIIGGQKFIAMEVSIQVCLVNKFKLIPFCTSPAAELQCTCTHNYTCMVQYNYNNTYSYMLCGHKYWI